MLDGVSQGTGDEIGKLNGFFSAGFSGGRIAFNKDGRDAEVAGGMDIGKRVADEDAVGGGGVREIAEGLVEESGSGLAAFALIFVVGAEVECVNARALGCEVLLELSVKRFDVGRCVVAEGNAALVGDDDDASAGAVERGDGGSGAGQEMEVAPMADVLAFGRLAVDDAVAIEEDAANVEQGLGHRLCVVTSMITKSRAKNLAGRSGL